MCLLIYLVKLNDPDPLVALWRNCLEYRLEVDGAPPCNHNGCENCQAVHSFEEPSPTLRFWHRRIDLTLNCSEAVPPFKTKNYLSYRDHCSEREKNGDSLEEGNDDRGIEIQLVPR